MIAPPQTTVRLLYLEVAPQHIAPLKFIFESYDDVAIVRTVDRHRAVIVLLIAPDFAEVATAILESVREQFPCRPIPAPPGVTDDWLMQRIADEQD